MGERDRAAAEQAPALKPITLLHELQRRYPGVYEPNVRRTLERRISQWRAVKGPEKVVMFPQTPVAGQVAQSDFSHMDDLGVTIAGAPVRAYHLPFDAAVLGFRARRARNRR